MTPPRATRREFLRRSTGLAFAGAAAPWALNLAAMSEAAAQSATDYKALVCVFLYGGNDCGNTLIPYDASGYANYAALRPDVCIARDALAGTVLQPLNPSSDGRQFALAPQLSPLSALFASGQLGVLMNIGPLMQPTTKLSTWRARCRCPRSCSRTTTSSRSGRRHRLKAPAPDGVGESAT